MPKIITLTANVFYNGDGTADGAIGAFTDLTERLWDRAKIEGAEPDWRTMTLSTSLDFIDDGSILSSSEVLDQLITWRGEVQAVVHDA